MTVVGVILGLVLFAAGVLIIGGGLAGVKQGDKARGWITVGLGVLMVIGGLVLFL
jgi:hypothetical protein